MYDTTHIARATLATALYTPCGAYAGRCADRADRATEHAYTAHDATSHTTRHAIPRTRIERAPVALRPVSRSADAYGAMLAVALSSVALACSVATLALVALRTL